MNGLRVRLIVITICGAVVSGLTPVLAQLDVPRRDDLAAAERGRVIRYPAAVVATARLTPDTQTDEIIADLTLETLSDGMVVMSGNLRRSQDIATPTTRPSIFLVADRNRSTYRAFRVRGAVEENERVKAHLKQQHGIDWDANRKLAPQRRARQLPSEPIPLLRWANYRTRFPFRFGPSISVRLASANTDTVSCSVTADLNIETRDLYGYGFLLARSRTYAAIATDYNPEWTSGEQVWAFSFSDQFPQNPTALNTHWYTESVNEVEYYSGVPLAAISWQDTTYYNDDFGDPSQRTWAWHYIYSQADRTSMIPFRVGYKNEYGEFSSVIASNLIDWSWSGCYYY
jgi:hypothetical protein